MVPLTKRIGVNDNIKYSWKQFAHDIADTKKFSGTMPYVLKHFLLQYDIL
jgi:hypothetical protein